MEGKCILLNQLTEEIEKKSHWMVKIRTPLVFADFNERIIKRIVTLLLYSKPLQYVLCLIKFIDFFFFFFLFF